MVEYIYFCSSLPALYHGAQPPISSQAFLASASVVLAAEDSAKLFDLDFSRASQRVAGSGFFCEYFQWEVALRNQIMLHRVKLGKLGRGGEIGKPHHGASGSASLVIAVEHALSHNPLEAEQKLDNLRWQKLNEICGARLFDMVFLAAYLLKLKLLERAHLWQKQVGQEIYETVSKKIVEEEKVGDV